MQNQWERCIRCGSAKVIAYTKASYFLIFFMTGGLFAFLGFFFPLLWILALIAFFLTPAAFFMKKKNECKECRHSWEIE